jgi:pimeloyl-ACP methyl ester carboxylesterase
MGLVGSYGTKGTESGITVTPHVYPTNGSVRGVVVCQGHGAVGVDALTPGGGGFDPVHSCGSQFPTVCNDFSSTTHWGNDAAQTKLGDAITFLQGALGAKSGGVLLYAASMGALLALNYARANPSKIAAIALGMPVVDLAYEHTNNVNGWATEIETTYGGSSAYASAEAGHDPTQHTSSYTSVPMKMWRASNDTSAITARQDAFASAVGCPVSDLGAVGHTLSLVPGAEVRDFLMAHA